MKHIETKRKCLKMYLSTGLREECCFRTKIDLLSLKFGIAVREGTQMLDQQQLQTTDVLRVLQ